MEEFQAELEQRLSEKLESEDKARDAAQ